MLLAQISTSAVSMLIAQIFTSVVSMLLAQTGSPVVSMLLAQTGSPVVSMLIAQISIADVSLLNLNYYSSYAIIVTRLLQFSVISEDHVDDITCFFTRRDGLG